MPDSYMKRFDAKPAQLAFVLLLGYLTLFDGLLPRAQSGFIRCWAVAGGNTSFFWPCSAAPCSGCEEDYLPRGFYFGPCQSSGSAYDACFSVYRSLTISVHPGRCGYECLCTIEGVPHDGTIWGTFYYSSQCPG